MNADNVAGLPSVPVSDAAHNCSTGLPCAAGAATATPSSAGPRNQWPAAAPPATAAAATTASANMRFIIIVESFRFGRGLACFDERAQRGGIRTGDPAARVGLDRAAQVVARIEREVDADRVDVSAAGATGN